MAKCRAKFKTGIDCPVCNKEIVVDDILNMSFIRQANSQPALLAACEEARSWIKEVLLSEKRNYGSNCESDLTLFKNLKAAISAASAGTTQK